MNDADRTSAPPGTAPPPAHRIVMSLDPSVARDNFALWSEQAGALARQELVDEADRPHFAVHVEVSHFGAMSVSTTRLSHAVRSVRTAQDIARTGLSHMIVQFFAQGTARGRCGAHDVAIRQGDVWVLDLAQPFEIEFASCTILALMAPREDLPPGLREHDLHGRIAQAEATTTGLLVAHLRALDAAAPRLTTQEGIAASRALLLLIEAAFPPERAAAPRPAEPQEQVLFTRACALVEAEIGDPTLSLAGMAERLGVSRTSLYRLFEGAGGAGAYIRERRLLRSYEIIDSDLQPQSSLGEIGIGQGFGSEAYFSRAFKERFGISPGVARKAAQARRRRGESAIAPPQTLGIPGQSMRVPKS